MDHLDARSQELFAQYRTIAAKLRKLVVVNSSVSMKCTVKPATV